MKLKCQVLVTKMYVIEKSKITCHYRLISEFEDDNGNIVVI